MRRLRVVLGLVVVAVVAAALVITGVQPRIKAREVLQEQANDLAVPHLTIVHPTRQAPSEEVALPGNIQAFTEAPIYARTSGYLKRWYFDIGAHVKRGQLLAEIESPEVDQQLQQARDDVGTAEANLKLAQLTAERYTGLLQQDSIAKQDVDTAVQNAAARATALRSAQANVRRLQEMVSFEKIYAPFDGVITARNTDVGQLIASGSGGAGNRELFHIAAVSRLRVFVNVPQLYSHVAKVGMVAELTLPELPGKRFQGTLVRTSDSFDQTTRTLLAEVDVENPTGVLFANAYTEVHFKMHGAGSTVVIPATSLIFRSEGLRVPVVRNGNRVAMIPVVLGRDFGNTVEVLSGINADSQVVADPPDSLVDGEPVRVVPKKTEEADDH